MAATVTVTRRMNARGGRINFCGFSTNENYVTGGFAITANQCGLNNLNMIFASPTLGLAGTAVHVVAWNGLTGKVQYFWVDTTVDGNPLVEVPNATAVGLVSLGLICIGD